MIDNRAYLNHLSCDTWENTEAALAIARRISISLSELKPDEKKEPAKFALWKKEQAEFIVWCSEIHYRRIAILQKELKRV